MEMPATLRQALEHQIEGIKQEQLMEDAQALSLRYRTQVGIGERLLTKDTEAVAYAASRMPATYGAAFSALEHALASVKCVPKTLLDVGAGTGAASWAADAILNLKAITCVEREDAMRRIGESMMHDGSQTLQNAKWISQDFNVGKIALHAELVIASYVLNEMTDETREKTVIKLWEATTKMLLLIEPGTPTGFSYLQKARQLLLSNGAHMAAPCTHEQECPIGENDWCHFTCRVSRSRLHRQLKGGEVPYEDEKFIYMALSREECGPVDLRILRHPQIHSGYIAFEVCTKDGIQKVTFSKKDAGYKQARKAETGDSL